MRRVVALPVGAILLFAAVAVGLEARAVGEQAEGASLTASATHRTERRFVPVERSIPLPVAIAPHYAQAVNGTVALSWRLPAGAAGARVEISPDLAFSDGGTERFDVDAEELAVSRAAGVWYWRLRGRSDGAVGDVESPPWMFFVESSPGVTRSAGSIRAAAQSPEAVPPTAASDTSASSQAAQAAPVGSTSLIAIYDDCLKDAYFRGVLDPLAACAAHMP
jgi:hypothetical protein